MTFAEYEIPSLTSFILSNLFQPIYGYAENKNFRVLPMGGI